MKKHHIRFRSRSTKTRARLQRAIILSLIGVSLTVSAGVFVGWYARSHHGRDVRIKQANLALQKGRPDLAIRLIGPVLASEPNDLTARILVIRARMKMSQLRHALSHVNQLVMLHPDRIDLRRVRIDVLQAVLQAKLSTPVENDDILTLGHFEDLLATATADIDSMSNVMDPLEWQVLRMRLSSLRIRNISRKVDSRTGEESTQDDTLQHQLQSSRMELESVLKQMVVDHPRQFEAWQLYIDLLVTRHDMAGLSQVADTLSGETILPPDIATALVEQLVFMDRSEHEPELRWTLGKHLLSAVHPRDRTDPRWIHTQARLCIISGQAIDALTLLDRLSQQQRNLPSVSLIRARALYDLGRLSEVVEILKPLALQLPDRPDILSSLGLAYLSLNQMDDAERVLRGALSMIPNDGATFEALATVLVRQKKMGEAQRMVEQLTRLHPTELNVISLQIQIAKADQREGEIDSLLTLLSQRNPLPDAALMMLIDGYDFLNDYVQVERYAQQLLGRDESSIVARLGMAKMYMYQAKYTQAFSLLNTLHAQVPDQIEIQILMGRVHMARRRYELAVDTLEPVVAAQPANADASMLLAQSLFNMHREVESRTVLTALLRHRPNQSQARFLLWQLEQTSTASHAVQPTTHSIAVNIESLDVPSTIVLARNYVAKGDAGMAKVYAKHAVAMAPQHIEARSLLIDILLQLEQFDAATIHVHALMENHPQDMSSYHAMYNLFVRSDQLEQGLHEAVALEGVNQTLSLYLQGLFQLTLGRIQLAQKAMEQSLSLAIQGEQGVAIPIADRLVSLYSRTSDEETVNHVYDQMFDVQALATEARLRTLDQAGVTHLEPQHVSQLIQAADMLEPGRKDLMAELMIRFDTAHQSPRVLALMEKWIAENPQESHLLRAKAQILATMGRMKLAIESLEDALLIDDGDLRTWRLLIDLHMRDSNYPSAERVLARMGTLDEHARVEAMLVKAAIYEKAGLTHQAATVAKLAASLDWPRDDDRLFRLAKLLARYDYQEQAIACLERVSDTSPLHMAAELAAIRLNYDMGYCDAARMRLDALMAASDGPTQLAYLILEQHRPYNLHEDWLRECDERMPIELLPGELGVRWSLLRAQLSMDRQDWSTAITALATIQHTDFASSKLTASMISILTYLGKHDQAKVMLNSMEPSVLEISSNDQNVSDRALAEFVLHGELSHHQDDASLLTWLVARAKNDTDHLPQVQTPMSLAPHYYASDLRDDARNKVVNKTNCSDQYQRMGLAWLALRVGLPQLAEQVVMAIHVACGPSILSHSLLLDSQLAQGKFGSSLSDSLIEQFPYSSRAAVELARRSLKAHDLVTAQSSINRLLLREPEHPLGLYLQATLHFAQGNLDTGISLLESCHVRGIDQQASPVMENSLKSAIANDLACALTNVDVTRIPEALALARLAVALSPQSAATMDTLGWVLHVYGDQQEANIYLNRAISLAPANQEVHAHLVHLYVVQGQLEWAQYHREQIMAGFGSAPHKSFLASNTDQPSHVVTRP